MKINARMKKVDLNFSKPSILDTMKLSSALRLAKKKSKDNHLKEAKNIYEDIIQKFPKNKIALNELQLLARGTVILAQDPPSHLLQPIINIFRQGKLEQVLSASNKMLEKFPNSVALYNIIGASNAGLMKFDDAIKNYKKAILINPDYSEAYSNMGSAQKDNGDLEAAILSYKQALKIRPDFAEAYNNLGIVQMEKGYFDKAIDNYKRALKIKPNFIEAYNNIGNALQEKGDLNRAVIFYKKVLKINPNYANAYFNMGTAMNSNGNFEHGINAFENALKIKPDYAEAYCNMALSHLKNGDIDKSRESYKQAIIIKPNFNEAYIGIAETLKMTTINKPSTDLQEVIISIIDRKKDIRPVAIAQASISLLKFEPVIKELIENLFKGKVEALLEDLISNLSKIPLLFKLMSVCPLPDKELELSLTRIRSALLASVNEVKYSSEVLHFQSALALQCFTNEYVYNQNEKENKDLAVLEKIVGEALLKGSQPSPQLILCLASYKALHHYKWCDLLDLNPSLQEVVTRQFFEPNQENLLKSEILVLQEITNKISSKVRDQYEESPYPRWVDMGLTLKPASFSKTTKELKLRLFDDTINEVNAPNILIAGCGTGQHSIGTASKFINAKVLAIDLSLSSLAYAKRKTKELGFKNIDYMQADILDLGMLDMKFDLIESAGVLHHMDQPMDGWRVLKGRLKLGGLMKIGLYSDLARKHIVKMREEINKLELESSEASMKLFRSNILKSNEEHHKIIQMNADFYSLSELRDLLFHVQEHRFTIPKIKDCLNKLGLKFCGFESEVIIRDFKKTNNGEDDPYDLDKWASYEESNPDIFIGMYQFWCQKVLTE